MMKFKGNVEAIRKAIEMCGGNRKFSHKTGISESSIVDWKAGRKAPNPLSCIKIEEAVDGKITRQEILPDYPWDKFK